MTESEDVAVKLQEDLYMLEEMRLLVREGAKDARGRKVIFLSMLRDFGASVSVLVPYGPYSMNDGTLGIWKIDDEILIFLNREKDFVLTFRHYMLPTAKKELDKLIKNFQGLCVLRKHLVGLPRVHA